MAGASSITPTVPLDASWSKSGFKVVKCSHVWVIENFSLCKFEGGELLKSSTFSANNDGQQFKWQLELYIKGSNYYSDWLSLYLHLVQNNESTAAVNADYKFAILDANYTQTNAKLGNHKFVQSYYNKAGLEQFIRRSQLSYYQLPPNDRLTIFCEVSFLVVVDAVKVTGQSGPSLLPQSRLADDFGTLLKGLMADFVLCAGGKEFKVHKAVLACRSPVFAAMFSHDTVEKHTNKVNIPDVSAPVLSQLLHFVYTGRAPNVWQDMAQGLLVAADKYQLDRLKAICEQQLSKGLTKENVGAMLELADRHNAEHLKERVIHYINLHMHEVLESDGWKRLFPSQPELLKQVFKALSSQQKR